eukprot:366536-Chlamydomonas_euryale.AAC.7
MHAWLHGRMAVECPHGRMVVTWPHGGMSETPWASLLVTREWSSSMVPELHGKGAHAWPFQISQLFSDDVQ